MAWESGDFGESSRSKGARSGGVLIAFKREENMVAKEWEDAELYNLETTDFNTSTMLEYVMDDERLEELSNL